MKPLIFIVCALICRRNCIINDLNLGVSNKGINWQSLSQDVAKLRRFEDTWQVCDLLILLING